MQHTWYIKKSCYVAKLLSGNFQHPRISGTIPGISGTKTSLSRKRLYRGMITVEPLPRSLNLKKDYIPGRKGSSVKPMQPGVFSLLRLLWVHPANLFLLNKVVETSGCCDQTVRPLLDSLIKCSPLAVDGIRDGIFWRHSYKLSVSKPTATACHVGEVYSTVQYLVCSGFTWIHPWNLKSSLLEANRPKILEMAKKCSYLTWFALTTLKNHKIDTLQVFLRIDASD